MSHDIKKFNLTYKQIPQVFSLPEKLYTQNIAETIPEEVLEQNQEQQKYIADTISQIDLDSDRNCYVDLDGHKASELRTDWLTRTLIGKPRFTKGVFPSFTQGDNTAASVGEILHTMQFVLPLNAKDRFAFQEVNDGTLKFCFVYRTADGKPAGLSFAACPKGDSKGEHKGWIMSTIQNSTGRPESRQVTVLASKNYVSSKPQSMVAMDTPGGIVSELKAAINNDKISNLIKDIFNKDGSLNGDYIALLASRIQPSINIDDRDRKAAQLHCLFELGKQVTAVNFQDYVAAIKKQMTKDIDFFKDGFYEKHLKDILRQFAQALREQTKSTKTTKEITAVLVNISERVAGIEALAEKNYRNIELANTYKALARRLRAEAATITFNGTGQDENKIVFLTQFDVSLVSTKIEKFYKDDAEIKKYFENKEKTNQAMQKNLAQVFRPEDEGIFDRNVADIGTGVLVGLVTGIVVALTLTGVLTPLFVALIAVTVGLVFAGIISGTSVHDNEKKYAEEVNFYHDDLDHIRLEHDKELALAEHNLQQGVDLEAFLEPEKPAFLSEIKISKDKPLTPEGVAHSLWINDKDPKTTLNAKNRFSLWAAKQENLGFGIKEVDSIIEKRYQMQV